MIEPYVKIPTTVEGMGEQLKRVADEYISGKLSYGQAFADLQFLQVKRQDLFIAALTVRWVGKKRLKLLQSIVGDIQISIHK